MLAAREFTVGILADAPPLSLVLPRASYERTFLIGQIGDESIAVCLSENDKFKFIECTNNSNFGGLIIPHIVIEVDEMSLFDPQCEPPNPGTLVRTDTHLFVYAQQISQSFGRFTCVILEANFPSTHGIQAGFSRWRIVIGEGPDKRVLHEIDTGRKSEIST